MTWEPQIQHVLKRNSQHDTCVTVALRAVWREILRNISEPLNHGRADSWRALTQAVAFHMLMLLSEMNRIRAVRVASYWLEAGLWIQIIALQEIHRPPGGKHKVHFRSASFISYRVVSGHCLIDWISNCYKFNKEGLTTKISSWKNK
jgi:hypothetical protein